MTLVNVKTNYEPLAKQALVETREQKYKRYRKIKEIEFGSSDKWEILTDSNGNAFNLEKVLIEIVLRSNTDHDEIGMVVKGIGYRTNGAQLGKIPLMKAWTEAEYNEELPIQAEVYNDGGIWRFKTITTPTDESFVPEDWTTLVTHEYAANTNHVQMAVYPNIGVDSIKIVKITDGSYGTQGIVESNGWMRVFGVDNTY